MAALTPLNLGWWLDAPDNIQEWRECLFEDAGLVGDIPAADFVRVWPFLSNIWTIASIIPYKPDPTTGRVGCMELECCFPIPFGCTATAEVYIDCVVKDGEVTGKIKSFNFIHQDPHIHSLDDADRSGRNMGLAYAARAFATTGYYPSPGDAFDAWHESDAASQPVLERAGLLQPWDRRGFLYDCGVCITAVLEDELAEKLHFKMGNCSTLVRRFVPASEPSPNPAASRCSADVLAHVNQVWDRIRASSPIYAILLEPPHMRLVFASYGRIIAHFGPLAPVHLNSKGILHGSVSSTVVDWASGMAIAATDLDETGVSTDMHLSYVSSARQGDVLEVEAWVSRAGKTLDFTNVEIRKMAPGYLANSEPVVTASHTKYLNWRAESEETVAEGEVKAEEEEVKAEGESSPEVEVKVEGEVKTEEAKAKGKGKAKRARLD